MSEEAGESKSIGAFFFGFLTGVLVCLGAGGALFFVGQQRSRAERIRAVEMELVAQMEAERARDAAEQARVEREKAQQALGNVKEDKETTKKVR
jgi:uncharacterized protein HemX